MKYETLGVMNSLNQSFEIDLQRNAKCQKKIAMGPP